LKGTIGAQLNDSLRRIVNKFAVIHLIPNEEPVVVIADESPGSNNNVTLAIRVFISGDLAFYATILGKPNMAPIWCNWCMLTKQAWMEVGHVHGEKWSINKLHDIRQLVEDHGMPEWPQIIMGCTHSPMFDAVPVENFIISMLHIIIGIGNSLIDIFLSGLNGG
jgi:hypothetical protein